MSKFRNKKGKNKLEVCGKVPATLIFCGVRDTFYNVAYGVRVGLSEDVTAFYEDVHNFENERGDGQRTFFSVTKDHNPTSKRVLTSNTNGLIVSIGMLRKVVKEILPLTLRDRYTHHYRGDSRKQKNKSMDWVKPDFKTMPHYIKILDLIQFVKESPCDIIEASASERVFKASTLNARYGYRRVGKGYLENAFLSKRYESTSWYNICRKCYYDDHGDDVWEGCNHETLRLQGMSYDTILSELAMTLD